MERLYSRKRTTATKLHRMPEAEKANERCSSEMPGLKKKKGRKPQFVCFLALCLLFGFLSPSSVSQVGLLLSLSLCPLNL